MSESDSLGTSASSTDAAEAFSALLASVARPIPQAFGFDTYGMAPVVVGSFGLAPTPPPLSEQVLKCPLCQEPFREPKVLACFHSFCKPCLERQLDSNEKVVCPQCNMETQLSLQLGLDSLLTDYGLESVLARQMAGAAAEEKGLIFGSPSSTSSSPPLSDSPVDQNSNSRRASCTGCKSQERASAFCSDCSHFLCSNCTMAHQYMHCFEGHRVEELSARCPSPPSVAVAAAASAAATLPASVCKCLQHRTQPLRFFCLSCNLAICRECTLTEHTAPHHQYEPISEVADKQMATMEALVDDARNKKAELLGMFKLVDAAQQRLNQSADRAHRILEESVHGLVRIIDEQRKLISKEIDAAYSAKHLQLTMVDKRIQQMSEKLSQTIEFTSRLVKNARPTEVMVFKQLLDTRLRIFLEFNPDVSNVLSTTCEIDAISLNAQTARSQVASMLGGGRVAGPEAAWGLIGNGLGGGMGSNSMLGSSAAQVALSSAQSGMPPTPIGRPPSRQLMRSPQGLPFSDSLLRANKNDFGAAFSAPDSLGFAAAHYEKWSAGHETGGIPLEPAFHLDGLGESPDLSDCASTIVEKASGVTAPYPPRSQIKRQKMIYHCKFGEFGVMEGQFTEPSGVAVNAQHDIVVADTNNHRIQVFDKEGRFKFQFGECGKRDGQLLYPNRVAVNKLTGDFVVTERSPTHQIQVYNQYGQFLRKFGANILQHPRGVCVDAKGRIIVVECKVMRVLIFDMFGNVQQKFSCSRYLEFPNGVCTNDRGEILISDNRAHCIKVFNYEGTFLRQIGGEGITNYPIGVGINTHGEVVVADNHNNFNLTVFSQDGTMIGALESKVKHAQCFDVALVDDGSVVLASKDYRLYLYRFQAGLQ